MITKNYKDMYKQIFLEICREKPLDFYDESGMRSYTHRNELMSWVFWKRINMVLSLAGEIDNKKILDFGCGGGILFRYLKEKNCDVTGCENRYLELSKKISLQLKADISLYENIEDISDEKFDVIFILDVLEHIDDPGHCIGEILKRSHKNTRIIVSGPTENLLYKAGRYFSGFSGDYHLRNVYQIEEELKKAGLRNRAVKELLPVFVLFRVSWWDKARQLVA